MKLFSILAVSAFLFSCNNTKEVLEIEPIDVKKAQLGDLSQESDPITINSAVLEGNMLTLEVEYSGGCVDHSCDLVGSEGVMKSLPAKRAIKLIHHGNGDTCREMVSETLKFDIKALALKETTGSEIILLLDGTKESISYIFP